MNFTVRNAMMLARNVPTAFHVLIVLRDLLAHNASMTVEHVMVKFVMLAQVIVHMLVLLMSISRWME